jgi:hypothetical protein
MKSPILSIIPLLLFGTTLAHGAVIMVGPGQSIQTAVNSASSGDTIRILNGIYGEQITISGKAVSLEGEVGGTIQISKLSTTNINAFIRIRNIRIDGDVNGTSTDLQMHDCQISGDVIVNRGSLVFVNSSVGANLLVNHSHRSNIPTTVKIVKSTITEKLTCKAGISILGYNSIRYAHIEGNSQIVGNHFNGRSLFGIGIDVNGSQTYTRIHNNRIHSYEVTTSDNFDSKCIGIRIKDYAKADITNNLIYDCYDKRHNGVENKAGIGIFVESTRGTTILGNALWSCFVDRGTGNNPGHRLVWAPFANVVFENNFLWRSHTWQDVNNYAFGGGVESVNNILEPDANNSPFVDTANGNFSLSANSPLINAGSPLPQYNDRDGSRNDIGMFGGHNFIPDGRTTNKPIVLGLDIAPIAVPTGGTVTIESTGATVK